jgi:hypothetical protein
MKTFARHIAWMIWFISASGLLAVAPASSAPVHSVPAVNSCTPANGPTRCPYRRSDYWSSQGYWNFGGCRRCDYWRCWWAC